MTTPSVGQRLSYGGALCTVRYVGEVAGAGTGTWLGVEWDDARRGKHDGVHKGVRYFSCRRRPPPGEDDAATVDTAAWTPASFVRPTRPADRERTFLAAVRAKYVMVGSHAGAEAADAGADGGGSSPAPTQTTTPRPVMISGKVVQEIGFEKVQRQLAQLDALRVVILDEMCVGDSDGDGDGNSDNIRQTCPSITDLDLSRNLFVHFRTVAAICRQLPALRSLRINGNRFTAEADLPLRADAFSGVHELAAEETLLSWAELTALATHFPALTQLSANGNQLTACVPASLSPSSAMASTLTTLRLEYNDFTALADLAGLTGLRALRTLHLKGCRIAGVMARDKGNEATGDDPLPASALVFSPTLHHVDLSYNRMASWAPVDALAVVFPGMRSLRIAHNPIYDNPHLGLPGGPAAAAAAAAATANAAGTTTPLTEESFMLTVARLGLLRTLNFSTVTAADRANAEMFYLSRIAKQLAAVAPADEARLVLAHHPRYTALCALYGEPAVVRHAAAANAAFLEARLVRVQFCRAVLRTGREVGGAKRKKTEEDVQTVEIPKSFDLYTVKGLVGRLFGMAPWRLRLVWETGEWDPVVGVDEEEEGEDEDEDEEEGEDEDEDEDEVEDDDDTDADTKPQPEEKEAQSTHTGRWVKREVELKDSPRQFGFCVDGVEARIRVEVR